MTHSIRLSRVLVFCLFLFLLTACTPASTSAKVTPSHITINIYDNYFDPNVVHVPPNQATSVTFMNKGINVHIVEVRGLIPQTTILPGANKSFTISAQARPYKMYDELYAGSGMSGTYTGSTGATQTHTSYGQTTTVKEAIEQYRSYIIQQADQLLQNSRAFVAAINADNLAKAKQLYAPAHQNYERIEPIVASLKNLDVRLDARENDLPADKWIGFHRIEKGLWIDGTTKGLQVYTQALITDVTQLRLSVAALKFAPTDVVDGAVSLLDEASHNKITGEEDRYSRTDLYDLGANVEGSQAAFEVFKVFLLQKNPALLNEVEAKFQQVQVVLAPFRTKDGYVSYNTLTDSDKRGIAQAIDATGESLSKVAIQLPSA